MITIEDTLAQMEKDASTIKDVSIDGRKGGLAYAGDRFKDTDTFVKGNRTYRDYKINQPEITHIDPATGVLKLGKDEGASALAPQALADAGYNRGITKGKDAYGRTLLQRQNDVGQNSDEFLTRNLLAPVSEQTTVEANKQRMDNLALASVFPSVLERNSNLKAGVEANQAKIQAAKDANLPPVIPKIVANTPLEMAGFQSMYSNKGVQRLTDDIKSLESTIAEDERSRDPNTKQWNEHALGDDELALRKKELLQKKMQLQQVVNMQNFYNTSFIRFPEKDRDINNQAYDNWMFDSAKTGLYLTGQMAAGRAMMLGDAYDKAKTAVKQFNDPYYKASPDEKLNFLSQMGRNAWRNTQQELDVLPNVGGADTIMETFQSGKSAWGKLNAVSYAIGSSLVSSLPTMAARAGEGVLTGNPVAGFIPGSLLFAGKNYGAQPEGKKDISLAIGSGVFENLAEELEVAGLFGGSSALNTIFSVGSRSKLADALVETGKAASKIEANSMIESLTKKKLLEMADYSHDFAKKQYLSKEAMLRGSLYTLENAGIQSGQEMLQHYAETVGQAGRTPFDPTNEASFTRNLVNAGIGGLGFAGAFAAPRMIANTAQWHAIDSGLKNYERDVSEAMQYNAENTERVKKGGGFHSAEAVPEVIKNTHFKQGDEFATDSFDHLPANRGAKSAEGFVSNVKRAVLSPLTTFFGRQIDKMIPSITDENGNTKHYLGAIKGMISGDGILSGAHMARFTQSLLGTVAGPDVHTMANQLGMNATKLEALVALNADSLRQGVLFDEKGDSPELSKTLNKWWLEQMAAIKHLKEMADSVGGITSRIFDDPTAILDSSLVDVRKWNKNKALILDTLSKLNPGEHKYEITKAINNIVSGNRDKAEMAKEYLSGLGLFNSPDLKQFFEPSIFQNVAAVKSQLARQIGVAKYLGKNGEILARGLSLAYNNGEFGPRGTDKALRAFKDAVGEAQAYFEIINGNYHPMDDHPNMATAIGWVNTAAMTAALGKATISSMAEVPYTMLGTTHELFNKQLQAFGTEFAAELGDDMKKGATFGVANIYWSWAMGNTDSQIAAQLAELQDKRTALDEEYKKLQLDTSNDASVFKRKLKLQEEMDAIDNDVANQALKDRAFAREMLSNLGFKHEMANIQSKFEFSDSRQHNAMAFFASMIGLRAQTDAMRIAVLTIAGDIMMNQVMVLAQVDPDIRDVAFATGQGLNKAQAAALRELQQYGLNVHALMTAMDEAAEKSSVNFFNNQFAERDRSTLSDAEKNVYDNIQTALGNFVDSRVVNPQPHNLPKFYYNPYLRVFTVMTRFMAAAHATILPRLYKQYLLSGNAGMSYSAFVTIGGSLLMSSVGNALKDQLSYGEESPYVKGKAKRAQRNLHSSGLLGQFERVSDFISPVYPQSKTKITEEPGKWAYEQAKDKSPSFNYVARGGEGINDILQGKTEKGVQKIARNLPVIGSFPIASRTTAEIFKDMKGN